MNEYSISKHCPVCQGTGFSPAQADSETDLKKIISEFCEVCEGYGIIKVKPKFISKPKKIKDDIEDCFNCYETPLCSAVKHEEVEEVQEFLRKVTPKELKRFYLKNDEMIIVRASDEVCLPILAKHLSLALDSIKNSKGPICLLLGENIDLYKIKLKELTENVILFGRSVD